MIREEDFAAAADCPPDMAFVRLERKFRETLEANLENSQSGNSSDLYIIEYMNHTLATAEALELDFLEFFTVPDTRDTSGLYERYNHFRQIVDAYTVRIQIRNIRVGPAHALPLDEDEKKHIRAYVTKIKELVDGSTLSTPKKEALLNRLNAFLAEVDRDRTSLQRLNDFMMSLAKTTGDAVEELEPAWKWARLLAAIMGVRQEKENAKLPPPAKKIEKPKQQQLSPPAKRNGTRRVEMDDDIPF